MPWYQPNLGPIKREGNRRWAEEGDFRVARERLWKCYGNLKINPVVLNVSNKKNLFGKGNTKITPLITYKTQSATEKLRVSLLDAADNAYKGLLKQALGNVNDKMNVLYVFH